VQTVDQALALIPGRRDLLNNIDDRLAHVIRFVERVLNELKPGVRSEVDYSTDDGQFVLSFCKTGSGWRIMHGLEGADDDTHDVPLVGASRQTRAEIFTVAGDMQQAPIERLIVAVAESLDDIAKERSPQLEVATRLVRVLEKAGFSDPLE